MTSESAASTASQTRRLRSELPDSGVGFSRSVAHSQIAQMRRVLVDLAILALTAVLHALHDQQSDADSDRGHERDT